MPGWAPEALRSGLAARWERPRCLGVERGLRCRCCCGRRGRGLGGFLGGCCLFGRRLCRSCLLRCDSLLGRSGLLCRRCCLLGWCCLLRCYSLLGGSGLLCRCCCLLGRCGLLRCYSLFGGSGLLCRCCCLLGRCSLLRCYGFCRCSFLRWGRFFSGWFFRSCHHVLLGSICMQRALPVYSGQKAIHGDGEELHLHEHGNAPHGRALRR